MELEDVQGLSTEGETLHLVTPQWLVPIARSSSPSLTILVCPLFLRVWGLHAPSPPEAERWAELIETTMENLERERVAASIMSAQLRLAGLAVGVGVRTIFDPEVYVSRH